MIAAALLRLLPGWLPWALSAGLAVAAGVSYIGMERAERGAAEQKAAHAGQIADIERRTAEQEREHRATEQRWRSQQRESMEIAHAEIDRLQNLVRRADAAAVGLRSQFAAYVGETVRAAETATTEQQRAAARARAGMQAELFGELDRLAGIYAAEAGRYRIAGLACEREHGAVAPP